MWISAIWILGALLSALAIVIDMRRLGASKVGLTAPWWCVVCALTGPLALLGYLVARKKVRRQMVDSVWRFVGGATHPLATRKARLRAMKQAGLIGPAIYKSCLRSITEGQAINREMEK